MGNLLLRWLIKKYNFEIMSVEISHPMNPFYEKLCRISTAALKPVLENIVLFCTLNIMLMLPQSMSMNMTWNIILESTCFNSCVIYLALALKYLKIRNSYCIGHVLHYIVVAFLVMLSLVNVFLFKNFAAMLHTYIIQLIAETNNQESSEFAQTYIFTESTFLLVLEYIIALLVTYLLQHFVNKISIQKINSWYYKCSPAILLLSVMFVVVPTIKNLKWFGPSYEINFSGCCGHLGSNPIFMLVNAMWQNHDEQSQYDTCAEYCESIEIDSCKFSSPNIVLIIGESYIKSHSSLYGYKLPTNPRLSQLDNLYVFNDVISFCNLTSYCFKNFMTCAGTDEEGIKWCDAPLFPAVFKKSGYNVIFWTNQFVSKVGRAWYEQGSTMFDRPKIDSASFNHRNSEMYQHDVGIIDDYKEVRSEIEPPTNNLVIFHLIGQHGAFSARYPQSQTHFSIDDYEYRTDLSAQEKQTVAEYDNATLYNDSIVSEIIDMYKEKDAVVIYFSDHGEEVYDFQHRTGRMNDFKEVGAPVFHAQLDVPFLVYVSDKYRQLHPELAESIASSVNRPFMTSDISHMLMDLAGIRTKWYNPKRSLINKNFNLHRHRIVYSRSRMEYYDYDEYCKTSVE